MSLWGLAVFLFIEFCVFTVLEMRFLTKDRQQEARKYIDTLASNWSRMEAQMVKDGNDCFLCWQAQALVNLAFITNGYAYAEEVCKRIGFLTDKTFKGE